MGRSSRPLSAEALGDHLVAYFEADNLESTLRDTHRFAAEVCPAFCERS